MLHKARDWKLVQEIPKLKTIEAPSRTAMFTPEVEEAVLNASPQPLRDILVVTIDTGMRNASETLLMRVEYINFAEVYYHNPKGKTRRARRILPLSDRVLELLRTRCGDRREGWVFDSDRSMSGHVEVRKLQEKFRKICRHLGLPDELKIYSGRHTYGTYTMGNTRDPQLVMATMGHADLRSTMPYLHADVSRVKSVIDQRNRNNQTILEAKEEAAKKSAAQKEVDELKRMMGL